VPTTAPAPLVYCVLVNWNGLADTTACLHSLTQQDYPSLHILVVDNGSADDSVANLRAAFPRIELLENGANVGFARGTNAGIRHAVAAGAEFIWLLNNDTVAPPDTCSKLVARALANPHAAIIGSVLYYMHDPAKVQAWGGGHINTLLGRTSHATEPFTLGSKTYLTFASVLIPRPVFEQVGVLYEGFFMYFDDTDFALRTTRAGYTQAVAEDTAILHKEQRRAPQPDHRPLRRRRRPALPATPLARTAAEHGHLRHYQIHQPHPARRMEERPRRAARHRRLPPTAPHHLQRQALAAAL
jgi:GT2 family glycosyltransferase